VRINLQTLGVLFFALGSCANPPPESVAAKSQAPLINAPTLSATRLLRRIHLTLRGREPTPAQYALAKAAVANNTLQAFLDQEIDTALGSAEFANQMVAFGHDYLKIGDYKRGSVEGIVGGNFKGNQTVDLTPCAAGTQHAGALGHFRSDVDQGDPSSLCDDAAAVITSVEPWWAPGTAVSVIGRSGNGKQTNAGTDCGRIYMGESSNNFAHAGCGCGPNLLYCALPRSYGPVMYPRDLESNPYVADAQRRLLFEEPARLVAHVITTDAPFSDLVVGNYTVAPRRLQHVYARWGRMNSDNAAFDSAPWWKTADDTWQKVTFQSIQPNLLDVRTYTFDPRTNSGAPIGVPSAGILTQLGPNVWYPRERVRAARWLETFACRSFTAPDPALVFMPPYTNDPARGGTCQHCHTTIDPAAIHFKRLEVEEDVPRHGLGHMNLGGIGDWQWRKTFQTSFADSNSPGGTFWFQPYGRWNANFVADTFLTPVPPSQIMTNPDARFLDFLPAPGTLFGQQSDGTIGPLGFGKLIVASGEFDKCAVQTIHERFVGRKFDPTNEAALETQLVQAFTQGGRKVKPLIKLLLQSDEFKRGL
jgi:hypothetical protein